MYFYGMYSCRSCVSVTVVVLTALLCCVNSNVHDQLKDLDQFIKHTIKCRKVPGLAVSLVRGDTVLFSRGYGKADRERGTRATEHTKFCIGSLTKAFTTALVADILSDHKNLTWDTPVRQILGNHFRLSDQLRTDNVNLRDLLAHRVGTPSNFHPLLVGFPEYMTRGDLVGKLQYMPAVSDFRSKFHYSNYMYMLAGHVAEVITGEPWEDMIQRRLLDPLGMRDTGFIDKLGNMDDIAVPYVLSNNQLTPVDKELLLAVSPSGPAGSIFTTASDMTKWMQFHFREGQTKFRQQLVNMRWLSEVYKPQMTQPFSDKDLVKPNHPISDVSISYNMGWMTSVYRGYRKLWHSGGIVTFTSQLWLFPHIRAGVFVTSSGTLSPYSSAAVKTITSRAADLLLGVEPWLNLTTSCTYPSPWEPPKHVTMATDNLQFSWNLTQTMKSYEGVYYHRGFGNITILMEESGQLYLHYGRFGKMRLQPVNKISFKGYYIDKLWFITNSDGNTNGITIDFVFSDSTHTVGLLFPVDFNQQRSLFSKETQREKKEDISVMTYTSISCDSDFTSNQAHRQHTLQTRLVVLLLGLLSVSSVL